ncbi:hypothetical protein SAMN06296273_1847 [Nitrosomonas ureae]|uniref:Uncharacterized protein n=1 Tax=Nitrosomonas ureae TaxID=44577 RepID=A0A285BZ80_9PROT|nr:hypothetical protein [Nitrosomonas ureae]SNX60385.1 hypothetical protein SAMN06296273_1847 [Nitrosomonas ureae]
MKLQERLRKLEALAKIESQEIRILKIIVEPDGTISGKIRRDARGGFAFVSDQELTEVHANHHLLETRLN